MTTLADRSAARAPRDLTVVDEFGRSKDSAFIEGEIARGAWRPTVVPPEVSGIPRPMTIYLAHRSPSTIIKMAWHGDEETFCPSHWADIAIGSGACGYLCRSCFLMLTHRGKRDPLRPVIYDNGGDFERIVRRWLASPTCKVTVRKEVRVRRRTHKDSIGLGIDVSDSLLWEGVTAHARRLIPLFTSARTNPLDNPLVLLTKSANTRYLEELKDADLRRVDGRVPNVAVTFSLNPGAIADLWEGKFPDTLERVTPPISRRLEAMAHAQTMGFEVRARIDPILTPPGWVELYEEFFNYMAHRYKLRPTMLTLGSYREKNAQLDTWRAKWELPEMEFEPTKTDGREGTHVHQADRVGIYRRVSDIIERAFSGTGHKPWVSLCKETHAVRKATGLLNANCNCLQETTRPSEGRRHLEVVR